MQPSSSCPGAEFGLAFSFHKHDESLPVNVDDGPQFLWTETATSESLSPIRKHAVFRH